MFYDIKNARMFWQSR